MIVFAAAIESLAWGLRDITDLGKLISSRTETMKQQMIVFAVLSYRKLGLRTEGQKSLWWLYNNPVGENYYSR